MLNTLKKPIQDIIKMINRNDVYAPIAGYQKGSLVDHPKYVSNVIFFKHCNMKCLYCHNIKTLESADVLSVKDFRKVLIDILIDEAKGLVLTGGEPTLYKELIPFLRFMKEVSDKNIKLDTNGSNPEVLEEIIKEGLVDVIAMDIKCKFENYHKLCDYSDVNKLYKSVEILNKANVEVIYRSVVGDWLTEEDVEFIMSFFPSIKLMNYRRN